MIYERPPIPTTTSSEFALTTSTSPPSGSALSTSPASPDDGMKGLSEALIAQNQDADLNVGIGMNPKEQETLRRKSVNHKAKEVVTTGGRLLIVVMKPICPVGTAPLVDLARGGRTSPTTICTLADQHRRDPPGLGVETQRRQGRCSSKSGSASCYATSRRSPDPYRLHIRPSNRASRL